MKRDPEEADPARRHRRSFIKGLGTLGIVGLAGCSGDDGGQTGTDVPSAGTTASGSPTRTTGSGSPTGTTRQNGTTPPTETPPPTETTTEGSPTPRTPPAVENPPASVTPTADLGRPPSDATVLFGEGVDGLEKWEAVGGGEPPWIVEDDYVEVDPGTSDIASVDPIGDCHLHVEFTIPPEQAGETGGNSGVFMMGRYEFQVLDNNVVEEPSGGMAGTYYRQSRPLANPVRPSTAWQSFDILWRAPRFDGGEVTPARTTMLFNGVVTQAHVNVAGATTGAGPGSYSPHDTELPLRLQDHTDPVRFRNVWYRSLPGARNDTSFQPTYGDDYQQPEYPLRDPPVEAVPTVDPGEGMADPPSDATMLLEGGDLSNWVGPDGAEAGWREEDGYVAVEPGAGNIRTEETFADSRVHAEFRIPEDVSGVGRDRGNSGVLLADRYEISVLDNHDNVSEPEHWVGAYTGQTEPLVSPTRPPGEWQSLDVVWEGPRFSTNQLDRYARMTVLLNGVVVQKRVYVGGPNEGGTVGTYRRHDPAQPLGLQENGDPVHFRNVWYRPFDR